MIDLEKMRFINNYKPKNGGLYKRGRLYEQLIDDMVCSSFNGGPKITEKMLEESLIASYDISKVKDIFERRFGIGNGIVFKVIERERNGHVVHYAMVGVPYKVLNNELKNEIISFMKFCGYSFDTKTKESGDAINLFFKPRFQTDDCTDDVRTRCRFVYHLTPASNFDKILKNGFVPKSENMLFSYPDRVYFFLGNNLKRKSLNLMKTVWKSHGSPEAVVLMVDLEKVPEDVIFRTDFDADEAIFTHDNISPYAIAGYKKFEELIGND